MSAVDVDRSIAIGAALGAFMDAQQTSQAVQLWRDKYAGKPTFSVQYFVRECCALFGMESHRNQLIQSLILELNAQRMNSMLDNPVRHSVARGQTEIAVKVFELLFRAMVDSAGPIRGNDISRYVAESLSGMKLARDTQRSLTLWLNRNMPVIESDVPLPVLVQLVNRAYVGLCEYCGPVRADQILHDCVNEVAKADIARHFHPQQLL